MAIELFYNFIQSFVVFNYIASVHKTELDFSSILWNAICVNVFIFVHSYAVSKIEVKEKMKKKVMMRLKKGFSND